MTVRPKIAFSRFLDWEDAITGAIDANRFDAGFIELHALMSDAFDAFDAIVPLPLEDYPALDQRPDLNGRRFWRPSLEAVALCHDKLALNRTLIAAGFGAHIPALREPGPPWPYIWKSRRNHFGLRTAVIPNAEVEAVALAGEPGGFAQTLVLGETEYAAHILFVRGQVRYAGVCRYTLRSAQGVNGHWHAPASRTFRDGCEQLELFTAMLRAVGYEGLACFDYKLQDGRPMVFEINPRFGGSLTMDINRFLAAYLASLAAAA